jgi:hypothetical protein
MMLDNMVEYLKSEQKENVYCILRRDEKWGHTVYLNKEFIAPVDGVVVGTFAIYESGYNPFTGDEVLIFLYQD